MPTGPSSMASPIVTRSTRGNPCRSKCLTLRIARASRRWYEGRPWRETFIGSNDIAMHVYAEGEVSMPEITCHLLFLACEDANDLERPEVCTTPPEVKNWGTRL